MFTYIIKHPNFSEYLLLLNNPLIKTYSSDDIIEVQKTITHLWKSDPSEATQFETIEGAIKNATSRLCGIFRVKEGRILEQIVVSY